MSKILFPRGSEWRRWDIHIHTKGTNRNDQFKSETFQNFAEVMFKKAIENEVSAIGITDYFSIENYNKVTEYVEEIDGNAKYSQDERKYIKNMLILPNVELRMIPVGDKDKLINIHCIFNPDYVSSLDNSFFGELKCPAQIGCSCKMNKEGLIMLGEALETGLDKEQAYKKGLDNFYLSHTDLQRLIESDKKFRENTIIAVSNSNRDGASSFQQHYDFFENNAPGSLDGLRKGIYRVSDCIFSGNENDIKYFAGKKTDSDPPESVKEKCGSLMPCIHGSDAHTEDKLFAPDNDRYCWIKADLTFEGFKQVLYEPEPGERVKIGPIKPDHKDDYKVIQSIEFRDTDDFPAEIIFNQNLCSIIGSRSSGKSALLAYVAHAIDSQLVEDLIRGPGEGAEYHWDKIDLDYCVKWVNGKTNAESPGRIVYLHQGYLYSIINNYNEIKSKIKPVLFKALPEFASLYEKVTKRIESINDQLENNIDKWFDHFEQINRLNEGIKNLGDKGAIEDEKKSIQDKIKRLREKASLSEEDTAKYQEISKQLSEIQNRESVITIELGIFSDVTEEQDYFTSVDITLNPSASTLPGGIRADIDLKLIQSSTQLLNEVNEAIYDYKQRLINEQKVKMEQKDKIRTENNDLIEKYRNNVELETLIKDLSKHDTALGQIMAQEDERQSFEQKKEEAGNKVLSLLEERDKLLNSLKENIAASEQDELLGITFDVEINFDDAMYIVNQKINTRDGSLFVDQAKHLVNISYVRQRPIDFMCAVYSGTQKITAGNDKKQTIQSVLTLTESILFTAEMENDKIGGFSEPTMTPGKRALFALKLLLAESDDTWPLLIDQPEDDLDSRSIYDEVVPFLKEKKKERQIIMVSHNANLVIGSDTEQIIVANRAADDRINEDGKQFNYLTGSIEHSMPFDNRIDDTLKAQGIKEHACQILDGGKQAFEKRRTKYNL